MLGLFLCLEVSTVNWFCVYRVKCLSGWRVCLGMKTVCWFVDSGGLCLSECVFVMLLSVRECHLSASSRIVSVRPLCLSVWRSRHIYIKK